MKLLKNIRPVTSEKGEVTDVLIAGEKIAAIGSHLDTGSLPVETIDMEGALATPGLIDIHVHTSGGGGQTGFFSLAPEVRMEDLIKCGTTSVVGLLGTDGFVKQLPQLYAKTQSLRMNGLSAYMLTGFYGLPTPTLTDCIANDLIFIDPVIGCKIAICDDRSSFPTEADLLQIISQVRLGGFTSAKRGVMHVHLGALPEGMQLLLDIAKKYPSLIPYISPTHTIRTEHLFFQAIEFAKMGGMMDVSTGGTQYTDPYKGVLIALKEGVSIDNMTFSSDGNGGVRRIDPETGEETYTLAPLHRNLEQTVKLIKEGGLAPKDAFKLVTENSAKTMSLKGKGKIQVGYDADFCFFTPGYDLHTVIARGKIVMKDGVAKKGSFEN
ncbi:MAG TPA: beta-aspartyl-peptidase [Porphyromonadaceae bacterium]|jgi:beta-aspartyl-dipeptidase (metallo-type)|nr:beta-aspartyl-peptidase [Porphyromonadaceae bacterium]HBL33607.1 beta-aspartyl-peptidase [Porphyromonadaceae bacterium]HBX19343.1 beta-aspartyl-peptidase [Porphyromonadaceae bacterium]HBX45753.1 beta-aspartyl-peptidase [Porphyromonadaceae bacterium]